MKPLKLWIKGIKSFYDEQEIDFTLLSGNNIFVISGVTGAGKSTVLDCVILALYGNKSDGLKQDEYINLKCSQAVISLLFQAECDNQSRIYRVSRTFYRSKNKSAKAMLTDEDQGIVLAEGEAVGREISRLIGLSCENFTKVIVLEQGRYSEFLKATKSKRTELVGSLFKLEKYKDLYRKASAKAGELKKQTELLDDYLLSVETLTTASIQQKKRQLKELSKREKELQACSETLQKRRESFARQRADYKAYVEAVKETQAAEAALRAANDALKQFEAANGDAESRKSQLDEAARGVSCAALARDKIIALSGSEQRRQELESKLSRMREDYRDLVNLQNKHQTELSAASKNRESAQAELELSVDKINALGVIECPDVSKVTEAQAARLIGELNMLTAQAELRIKELAAAQDELAQKTKGFLRASADWERINAALTAAVKELKEKEDKMREAADVADKARTLYAAQMLREKLREGEPCPVCGSTVAEAFPCGNSGSDFQSAAAAEQSAAQEVSEAKTLIARLQSENLRACEDRQRLEEESIAARKSAEEAAALAGKLPSQKDIFSQTEKLLTRAAQLAATIAASSSAEEAAKAAEQQTAAKAEGIKREGAALKSDLDNVKKQMEEVLSGQSYEIAAEAAAKAYESAKEREEAISAAIKNYERDKKVLEANKAQAVGVHKSLAQSAARLACTAPDEQAASKCDKEWEEVKRELGELYQNKGALSDRVLQEESELAIKRVREKERAQLNKRQDRLSQLMKMFKGDRFLEFISQEYIEDFCDCASKYLSKMSGGCYTMGYDCEVSEFYVMDFRAGNMKRSVKTLSGGETFLASLSLAIAVSKAIAEKNNAGLKFDFLFLDEGFGTLHRDAIAVVERALRSLSAETLVGIVTHRSELSELITDKLIIECADENRGSSVRVVN